MRLHQYRTLAAMAALADHFTVAEVARYSGVKETTVRTHLKREEHRLEVVGKGEIRGRGGVAKVYRLVPGAREDVMAELRAVEEAAGVKDLGRATSDAAAGQVPRGLRAALDVLLFRIPRAAMYEWPELIDLASISVSSATRNRAEVDEWLPRTPARAYLTAAQFLLDLAVAEQSVVEAPAVAESPFHDLAERLGAVIDEVRAAGEMDLAEAVTARFEGTHPTELPGKPAADSASTSSRLSTTPPMTVYLQVQDRELVVEIDLPNVDRDSISVGFEGNVLVVEARRASTAPSGSVLLVQERPTERFQRRLFVDNGFAPARCNGSYEDGVLTVRIPAAEVLAQSSVSEEPQPLAAYGSTYAAAVPVTG